MATSLPSQVIKTDPIYNELPPVPKRSKKTRKTTHIEHSSENSKPPKSEEKSMKSQQTNTDLDTSRRNKVAKKRFVAHVDSISFGVASPGQLFEDSGEKKKNIQLTN